MDLESMYQEVILDHYRSPHGKGEIDPYDAEVFHVNPTCGDEVTLRVKLSEDADPVVEALGHVGQGCSISQASASVLYDQVNGQPLGQAMSILDEFSKLMYSATSDVDPDTLDDEKLGDAIAFEGVAKYPARIKCALLSWMAFREAVETAQASKLTSK